MAEPASGGTNPLRDRSTADLPAGPIRSGNSEAWRNDQVMIWYRTVIIFYFCAFPSSLGCLQLARAIDKRPLFVEIVSEPD